VTSKSNHPRKVGGGVAGRFKLAALGCGVVLACHTGLATRASLFIHYLEASRNAEGIAGKITLWERVVFSFILSSS